MSHRTISTPAAPPIPALPIRGAGLAATLGLGAALFFMPNASQGQEVPRVDVELGAQPSVAPCPGWGEVGGLDPKGDGFLAVRTGPSTRHEQVDELHNGDVVILCDYENGWHGVVYPGEGQDSQECYADSQQRSKPAPYRGPCRSGWVHGNWVQWIDS